MRLANQADQFTAFLFALHFLSLNVAAIPTHAENRKAGQAPAKSRAHQNLPTTLNMKFRGAPYQLPNSSWPKVW